VNLRNTLDDLDVLVNASKPATKNLAPLFRELRPLITDARPVVRDLSLLVHQNGSSNDLTDLLRTTPELSQVGHPALGQARKALRQSTPLFEFSRPYGPELIAWLRDFGLGAANYDANGHYARVSPVFMSHRFVDTPDGGELRPTAGRPEVQRPAEAPGAALRRRRLAEDHGRLGAVGRREQHEPCDLNQVPPGP
jgi:phospholipid/cholesterol/gamma-HCH transport system substrate-binding protein